MNRHIFASVKFHAKKFVLHKASSYNLYASISHHKHDSNDKAITLI